MTQREVRAFYEEGVAAIKHPAISESECPHGHGIARAAWIAGFRGDQCPAHDDPQFAPPEPQPKL